MSTVFKWDEGDIENLLASCEIDGLLPYINKYFPKKTRVLESGCGLGRYVRYMQDRDWDMTGLEIDRDAVVAVKKYWPDLKIIKGDSANSPFKDSYFEGIISLGVIEHWTEGPSEPLKEMYRTLKPGGIALITVPCLNTIRKLKHQAWWNERKQRETWKSWRNSGEPKPNRLNKGYKFFTHPAYGEFFEYRFTTDEFRDEVKKAGFKVIEHRPSAIIDGVYHELNPGQKLAKFKNWQFKVSPLGKVVNATLSLRPFFHPHMQLIIARKPQKKVKQKVSK